MATAMPEHLSLDEVVIRAANRERRIVLFYARERYQRKAFIIHGLTIALCVVFLLLLSASPVKGQHTTRTFIDQSQPSQWSIDRIEVLQRESATHEVEDRERSNRVDALSKRVENLTQQLFTLSDQLSYMKGLGASFAVLLMLLHIWSFIKTADKDKMVTKEKRHLSNREEELAHK